MQDIQGKPLVVGDVIFVRSGRFMGCVLSLVGMRARMFQCRNETYGTPTEIDGSLVNVIETRAVEFYRHF